MDRDSFLILAAFLALFIALTYLYSSYASDEVFYLNAARDMVDGKGYTGGGIAPIMSTFIAALLYVFKNPEVAAKLINPISAVVTAVVIYLFSKSLFGKESKWSLIIFLTLPMVPILATRILPDSLFNMFFVLSTFFFYRAVKSDSANFVPAGLFATLAFFTRYSGILLLPIFILYFLVERKLLKVFHERGFYLGLLAFLISFLGINFAFFGTDLSHFLESFASYTVTTVDQPFYYYLEFFPLVSLAILPLFVTGLIKFSQVTKKLKVRKEFVWLMLSLAFLVIYKFLFLPVREYRYLIDTSLFVVEISLLGIMYAWIFSKSLKRYLKPIVIVLVVINFSVAMYLVYNFANSNRYIETKEASLWANENCVSPIMTNAGRHTDFYTDLNYVPITQKHLPEIEPGTCILYSSYEPVDEPTLGEVNRFPVVEQFGGIFVYRANRTI